QNESGGGAYQSSCIDDSELGHDAVARLISSYYYLTKNAFKHAVSSVEVTYSCSSSEKRSVYCSSDGENVTYSWTFRGTPYTDQPADGNQTLLLDKESVGSVTCYAQNHVSRGNKTIQLDPCRDTVFVCVWVLEMITLMSLLGGFHIYARIRRNQIKREEESLLSRVPECRFTPSYPCYGAVGHPLHLQLRREAQLTLKKYTHGAPPDIIFKFNRQKITRNPP
ncbi:hypothetical protein NFI96_032855, partial [Prochilodus magdalenae]